MKLRTQGILLSTDRVRTDVNAFYMPSYKVQKGNHGMAIRTHGASLQSDLDGIPLLNHQMYVCFIISHHTNQSYIQLLSLFSWKTCSFLYQVGIHGNSKMHDALVRKQFYFFFLRLTKKSILETACHLTMLTMLPMYQSVTFSWCI